MALLMFVIAGGGVRSATNTRRRRRRLDIKDAIRQRTPIAKDLELSIFDVFWDLGVNEYALEIMGNQGFLIRDLQDLGGAFENLRDAVEVEGSYSEFIRETLETIQEFYDAHKQAGNRRLLPAMEVRQSKTLELPAITSDQPPAEPTTLPVPFTGGFKPIVAQSFDERVDARSGAMLAPLTSMYGGASIQVDVDDLVSIDPKRLLKGLFDGSIANEINRWTKMWNLRDRRDALDRELTRFYQFYTNQAAMDPRFYGHLYDVGKRWDLEVRRVEGLIEREKWKGKPWGVCAGVLMGEALAVSRQLCWLARNNVDQTVERIHDHARRGDTAMAGYLVYLNHHAFFAGKGDDYAELVRRVETATYRIQEELRELQKRGVV